MHEWALANSIIETLKSLEREYKKKIVGAKIVLGELQSIDKDVLEYALNLLKTESGLEDVEFEYAIEEAEFLCRDCSYKWKLSEVKENLEEDIKESIHFVPEVVHSFLSCPRCKSRDFEVVKGRGIYIESIKVKENDGSKN